MDVNGTRFHLVLGERDWLPPRANGGTPAIDLEWDVDAVRLRKLLPSFPARHGSTPLAIDTRRGAARDRFGTWYWISEAGHEIRVSRMRRRPSTRFWSAEDAARVFGQFYRAEGARRLEGSGLGLYICEAIVSAHGGRIPASSPGPGHGSTFSFHLPLHDISDYDALPRS